MTLWPLERQPQMCRPVNAYPTTRVGGTPFASERHRFAKHAGMCGPQNLRIYHLVTERILVVTNPKCPADLKAAPAKRLWKAYAQDSGYELNAYDVRLLTDSCRLVEMNEALYKRFVATGEVTSVGSRGQEVESPIIASLRANAAQISQLLAKIGVDLDVDVANPTRSVPPPSGRFDSRTGTDAARARHGKGA